MDETIINTLQPSRITGEESELSFPTFDAGTPLFSHALFPVYMAVLLWRGFWLRDRRVGALLADPSLFY
jgi:hypothetical protein